MYRFDRTIVRPESPEDAFSSFAELSSAPQWDPGVRSVKRITPGPTRVGTRYRVESNLLGEAVVEYEVIEWCPPHRVAFEAAAAGFRTADRMTFKAGGCGTQVRYESSATFSDASARVQALRARLFQAAGDAAMDGLESARVAIR